MRRLAEYRCGVCGESDYGKAPRCKCEREYERKEKERKICHLRREDRQK